jgi:L-proline---[L-prolyl-carrier protein] ligase
MTMRMLADLLLESARRSPAACAVQCPLAGAVSYGALDAQANRIAQFLLGKGVKSGDRVGLFMPKSAAAVAAMQGVLRVGAAYVPIDPQSPATRAAAIVADCGMSAIVGSGARLRELAAEPGVKLPECLRFDGDGPGTPWSALDAFPATQPPAPRLATTRLAYVLYTSGSTGTPKGVCISQENALAFIDWATKELAPSATDVLGNHAPFHFDLSVLDLYVAFAAGASVVIVPETVAYVPKRLVELIVQHQVTIWYSVPSALILMMEAGGLFDRGPLPLKTVCFAGEPFAPRELRRLRRGLPEARLLNLYGPTETNVCTFHEVESEVSETLPIPIGNACSGDEAWAQKDDGSRAGPGESGELWVKGPTVMLGYWGREPHPRGAPYPTGDLVRVRPDGAYDYLGRRDQMVKLRGYRVELGEVETALGRHPEISQVAAAVVGAGVSARLVAAAVPRNGNRVPLLELKALCAKHVPRYMIIDRVVWLDSLPRTPNGKLDRKAITLACAG